MLIFDTRVYGIPCKCQVISYAPYVPVLVTGAGYGDAISDEQEEFSFNLLDHRSSRRAEWLEKHLTEPDHTRLLEEYLFNVDYEYYNDI